MRRIKGKANGKTKKDGNGQSKKPIQIDADSIKVNEDDDGIDVHGLIKIIFSGF